MPTLFCYGTQKRVMFHSEESIAELKLSPHNVVKEFDCGEWASTAALSSYPMQCAVVYSALRCVLRSGHWIMHRKTTELVAVMQEFLARPIPSSAQAQAKL
jgi:hypothetical protein